MKLNISQHFNQITLVTLLCVVASSYFIEHILHVLPCPMCLAQRYIYITLAACYLMYCWIDFRQPRRYLFYIPSLVLSLLGVAIAGRQSWLQLFPPENMMCFNLSARWIAKHSYLEAIAKIFQGSANCAIIDFKILGISLAGYSLLLFSCLFLFILSISFTLAKQ